MTGSYVITGAGSGIGGVLAATLRERGDRLVLPVRSSERADDLRADFPEAELVVADLASAEAAGTIAEVAGDRIDGVVHAAGVVDVASVAETEADSLAQTVQVNLVAPMLLTQRLLEPVRRARGTHVFVNSGSGLRANPQWASYNASKFGLRGFADALRQEEAEHGVRVSTVYPGRTATRMQQRVHAQEGKDYDPEAWIRPETVAEEIVRVLDLGRDATIPDVVIRPN